MKILICTILLLAFAANIQAGTYYPGDHWPFCTWPQTFRSSFPSYAGQVEISKYIGVWYEQARKPMLYEKTGCAKATYTADSSNPEVIGVFNSSDDPEYPNDSISGKATLQHYDETSSKFSLVFNLFARGNYWILDLDSEYKYALIGDPCKGNLFVLSRERVVERNIVDEWVAKAQTMGYDVSKILYRKSSC